MPLPVATTNHDPLVIVNYYLDCIKQIKGCPGLVQTDCGTENVLASIQGVFYQNTINLFSGPNTHGYGSSLPNQCIKAWWSHLQKNNSEWCIDLCKELVAHVDFEHGNFIHIGCLLFSLMALIQQELNMVASEWNSQHCGKSILLGCPSGVHDKLYYRLAELSGNNKKKNKNDSNNNNGEDDDSDNYDNDGNDDEDDGDNGA